jgi:transposase
VGQTARSTPAGVGGGRRPGAEFFADPAEPTQRRYEALRAYLLEGQMAAAAAARFGYTEATLASLVRDFRAGRRDFFQVAKPGPKTAPAKERARSRIIELRRAGRSAYEIAQTLAAEGVPLNRTGVAEVLAEEGFPRLWPRPQSERGLPRREGPIRAERLDFAELPSRLTTRVAGLALVLPDLVALDLPGILAAAGYPGTTVIPAMNYVLSLLALKLVGMRRVSHVEDLAADPGAGLFAGLTALPKATALTTYSYRLSHPHQQALLTGLSRAALAAGLVDGADFDLDFHAIMHWGEDVALERHYVPRRSQRTRSVLSFFAQDATSHTLVYANADLSKATQNDEVLAFADHWKATTGAWPAQLVFDSRLTTQRQLAALDERGIRFLTPRTRSTAVLAQIAAIPASAYRQVVLDRTGAHRTPRIADTTARLSNYPRPVRQLVIDGLGHDEPTVLITNDTASSPKKILERYAQRMTIEQRLGEAIRAFHIDALASAVPLNVDLDVALSVLAHTLCAALRRRLPGYATATPDTLQRRFLSTGGTILNQGERITVRLDRRTYSPVLRSADLPDTQIPWWGGRTLHLDYA